MKGKMVSKPAAIIVIGASAGGLNPLKRIVADLPSDLSAAVLVVMHIGSYDSVLPQILSASSTLPVRHAVDFDPIEAGVILIAPTDHHLLVEDGRVRLSRGAKENFSRPAVDPLFRSAALAHKEKVIGVVLSGRLDDGTVGLQAIKAYGGTAMVQDPAEAEVSSMPFAAIDHVDVDYCLPVNSIAAKLVKLAEKVSQQQMQPSASISDAEVIEMENAFYFRHIPTVQVLDKIGSRSMFTCPECAGILWEIKGEGPQRFRCHTGHAFTASALAEAQNQTAEEAIWAAVRALHEKESLLRRFAEKAGEENRIEAQAEYAASADATAEHSEALRKLIGSR